MKLPSNYRSSSSSDGQVSAFPFRSSTDRIVPADYTGDAGKSDAAVFRPSNSDWYQLIESWDHYSTSSARPVMCLCRARLCRSELSRVGFGVDGYVPSLSAYARINVERV